MGEINRLEGVQCNAARFVCDEDRLAPKISAELLVTEHFSCNAKNNYKYTSTKKYFLWSIIHIKNSKRLE